MIKIPNFVLPSTLLRTCFVSFVVKTLYGNPAVIGKKQDLSSFEHDAPVGDDIELILRRLERGAAHFFNRQLTLVASFD